MAQLVSLFQQARRMTNARKQRRAAFVYCNESFAFTSGMYVAVCQKRSTLVQLANNVCHNKANVQAGALKNTLVAENMVHCIGSVLMCVNLSCRMTRSSTPSSCLRLPPTPHPCSSWRPTPHAPWCVVGCARVLCRACVGDACVRSGVGWAGSISV